MDQISSDVDPNLVFPALRRVIQADAVAWMTNNRAAERTSVVTSLPDISEMSGLSFDAWRQWFIATAVQVMSWVPADGVSIFFQSDIRYQNRLVDKGYLIMRAAEELGATLLWHKIVCRKPPGTIAFGRPSYSHMICVSPSACPTAPSHPGPDVLADAGRMSWSRAMGEAACVVACRYLREETTTRVVVDPFCGKGSILAVANAHGFAAIGVDLSAARCRAALKLTANT